MTAPRLVGPIAQRFRRDEEGHRFYEIDWHIVTFDQHDNLAFVLANWPLFAVGSPYNLATYWPEANGTDLWAFCTPELNIAPHPDAGDNGPVFNWVVTQYWSTKQSWRCNTFPIEDPTLEPKEISGSFVHEQRTASLDRFDAPLRFPNFQPITGPATEYQYSYPTVTISWNQALLPLATITLLINKVNDATLWGMAPRKVRFTDAKFERRVYGNCFYYWNTSYTFELNEEGFDIDVPFVGTKEYNGSGSIYDPRSFIPVKSDTDENDAIPLDFVGRRLFPTGIDGSGNPTYLYPQLIKRIELFKQGDLTLLDIPTSLS